jgi:hypothetical protein
MMNLQARNTVMSSLQLQFHKNIHVHVSQHTDITSSSHLTVIYTQSYSPKKFLEQVIVIALKACHILL